MGTILRQSQGGTSPSTGEGGRGWESPDVGISHSSIALMAFFAHIAPQDRYALRDAPKPPRKGEGVDSHTRRPSPSGLTRGRFT
jgi:hypothetical protein